MTSKLPDGLTFNRAVERDLRAYLKRRGIKWDWDEVEDLAWAIADNLVEWCHEWGTADCDYELHDPENPDEVGCFRVSDEVRGWMRANCRQRSILTPIAAAVSSGSWAPGRRFARH